MVQPEETTVLSCAWLSSFVSFLFLTLQRDSRVDMYAAGPANAGS